MKPICAYILVAMASVMVCSASYAAKPLSKQGKRVAKALMSTDPNEWQLVESIDLKFDTYHPQGMLKVDDTFYITTVKVERRPRYTRQGKQVSVMDEGAGKGYLMQFDAGGNLLKCIELCEGAIFHPGGMDFDGRYIWVPITKYYPYSRSLIVRVDVRSHQVDKVCYVDDSIGAIIHDTDNNILVGANWDADEFLTWQLDSALEVKDAELTAAERRHANTAKHLAIQDSKYIGGGSEDANVRLNKIGSDAWQKTKAKARKAAKDMAGELIQLYAARKRQPGFAFAADSPWQKEFEDNFPYPETDDQLRCIADIKHDMESPTPMDRLLCGDVGFGKTEVALRAVMKAVMDGKQVAILGKIGVLH